MVLKHRVVKLEKLSPADNGVETVIREIVSPGTPKPEGGWPCLVSRKLPDGSWSDHQHYESLTDAFLSGVPMGETPKKTRHEDALDQLR